MLWLIIFIVGANCFALIMCQIWSALFDSIGAGMFFALTTLITVATFILWHKADDVHSKLDKVEKLLRQRGEGRDEIKIPEDTAKESEESK